MFIIERTGWNQWYDDGGRWIGNRESARGWYVREEAEAKAAELNAELGDDCTDCVAVEMAEKRI